MGINKVKNLLVLTVFVISLMGTTTLVSFADPPRDAEYALQKIQKCKRSPDSAECAHIAGGMSSVYRFYISHLSSDVRIIESNDPTSLELAYKKWEFSKNLQVIHELIDFNRMLARDRNWYSGAIEFAKFIDKIKDSCKRLESEANGDTIRLRAIYWKLRFIEPASGVKEMLVSVEAKIEIELVNEALRDTIAKGETNIGLEQRIATLPEDAKKDIENLRSKLLDEKARQLAMAKEEEAKREKALRRQQEIDQAIKLRKQEIDTGKINSNLQQQLNSNPELRSAVALWESQYRKELADKKAWEAKNKLEKIELAKTEERKRKEAEIAERRRIEEENRIQAKLQKHNVKAKVTGFDLHSNPFAYEGESVVIRLKFDRMTERTAGFFTSGGYDILVSKLPTDLFTRAGQVADLIVKVKGTAEGILLATPIKIPHVEYIDILQ